MASHPVWPKWLEELWWREVWLTLEAAEPAILPPYLGSTLRGALGYLLRAALCEGLECDPDCQRPDRCRYYSLFVRDRDGAAKPYVLLAPPPPGLEEIALGGPVDLPYRTAAPRHGECIPSLRCDASWKFDPGGSLRFGLRLFGQAAQALPAIVNGIVQRGLTLGRAQFRLAAASDSLGRLLYDRRLSAAPVQMPAVQRLGLEPERACRVRIVFLSPVVFKLDRQVTFNPQDFAARFFEHSIGRAGQMHRACSGERPPWVDAPSEGVKLVGHRLFHYELQRYSFHQEKRLDFDGAVGYLDLEGDLGAVMPWGRAAEILHFGQKAVFGLGKVRLLVLD
jgi:hypothetical protein